MTLHMNIIIFVIFSILLGGCFSNKESTDSLFRKSHDDYTIISDIEHKAYIFMGAYNAGDFEKAREELDLVSQMLSLVGMESDSEKVAFLDKNFPQMQWNVSFAKVMEDLSKQEVTHEIEDPESTPTVGLLKNLVKDSATVNIKQNGEFKFDKELDRFIQGEILKVALQMGEMENFQLPEDFVKEIKFFIRRFQKVKYYRNFFIGALKRSRKYIPALRGHFLEKNFPEEIMYLAFIESGFKPTARSRANAVGLFQFIKSTGKRYDLKINGSLDERYSPIKSAIACRNFLHDLLLELGSFTLAISSYNSGAGKTRRALRHLDNFKERSFWALRKKTKILHKETREYVPQIFAVIVMAKPGNPPRFGFQDVPFPDASRYSTVIVPKRINLAYLAKYAKIDIKDILALNPDLKPGTTKTPYKVLHYPLFVPKESAKKIKQAIRKTFRPKSPFAKRKKRALAKDDFGNLYIKYKVHQGNTLGQISDWFGKPIIKLREWNPYLNTQPIKPGDIVYVRELANDWKKMYYQVGKGETLSKIARRYKVRTRSLQGWNGLRNSIIVVGQKLIIYSRQADTADISHKVNGSRKKGGIIQNQTITINEKFIYTVVGGNKLEHIAKLFGVSAQEIREWNHLRSDKIRVGQRLRIVSNRHIRFYKYRVRRGDTLEKVSHHFGVDIEIIMFVNGKEKEIVRVGEVLNIFVLS